MVASSATTSTIPASSAWNFAAEESHQERIKEADKIRFYHSGCYSGVGLVVGIGGADIRL